MPAARKTTRKTASARSATRTPPPRSQASRREVERRIARLDKHLGDATEALQALGTDLGRGGRDAYKEVTKALRALRREAQRTNRTVLKDFDKLRVAVTPSGAGRRASAKSTSSSGGATAGSRSRRARHTTVSTAGAGRRSPW